MNNIEFTEENIREYRGKIKPGRRVNVPKIAFDVDGTLISTDKDPEPRLDVIMLLRAFDLMGWDVYVHSGGGVKYAEDWVRRLRLDEKVHIHIAPKGSPDHEYDIAVDDAIDPKVATVQGVDYRVKAKYFIQV